MDVKGGGLWLFIHLREQRSEARRRKGSSPTFDAPTAPGRTTPTDRCSSFCFGA